MGGTITLNGSAESGPRTFQVSGILAPVPDDPDPAGRSIVVPLKAAQALFSTDSVDLVDLGLVRGSGVASVTAALERRLSVEPYTLTTPDELVARLRAATADFRITIALVAARALFGGAFLIFNTLAMTVAERARDVGLLRAAGMTRRQVTLLVLISALHLGVVGVALGVAAGVGLAAAVTSLLSPGGGTLALRELVIPPGGLLLGALLGFGVTVAAALACPSCRPDLAGRGAHRPAGPDDRPPCPDPLADARLRRRRGRRDRALAQHGHREHRDPPAARRVRAHARRGAGQPLPRRPAGRPDWGYRAAVPARGGAPEPQRAHA